LQQHPHLKPPVPLTDRELKQIKYYKDLQTHIHRGPLFTQPTKRDPDAPAKTFSEAQVNQQYGSDRLADVDPFNGVETYSMRYAPKQNALPKLSSRPLSMQLNMMNNRW
jgi:DNA-directed RNA polymerase III subunit RPC7